MHPTQVNLSDSTRDRDVSPVPRARLRPVLLHVRFEVRNAGPSIDQSTLNQMFEPLKRGPALENRYKVDDGLGLGRFIVREIVRAHGGEIDAQSANVEIVFAVRLPRDHDSSNNK